MTINYFNLKDSYNSLFNTCGINPSKLAVCNGVIAKINANQSRYKAVATATKVPWYVIAVIHSLEANLNFYCHLHNGDPLSHRTVHVPAGRPVVGKPPFTWEESAADAIRLQKLDTWNWAGTGISGILYKLEEYNGWGYRPKGINSPYLWAGTNHYSRGKYIADGHYDPTAVSQQLGAATILKSMANKKLVAFA